jgi:hypothetical protein
VVVCEGVGLGAGGVGGGVGVGVAVLEDGAGAGCEGAADEVPAVGLLAVGFFLPTVLLGDGLAFPDGLVLGLVPVVVLVLAVVVVAGA